MAPREREFQCQPTRVRQCSGEEREARSAPLLYPLRAVHTAGINITNMSQQNPVVMVPTAMQQRLQWKPVERSGFSSTVSISESAASVLLRNWKKVRKDGC